MGLGWVWVLHVDSTNNPQALMQKKNMYKCNLNLKHALSPVMDVYER